MGIIIKQSIRGSIWSYLGVVVGFITTSYLYPKYLTPDIIGLFSILLAFSALLSQFSSLGFNGVTARLFPYFRDKSKGHNGYLFISLAVLLTGFVIFLIFFYFYQPYLVKTNIEKSSLFVDYMYLIIPITFFLLFFNFLDSFNKMLYDAVLGIVLKEFIQRLLLLLTLLLYIFKLIDLNLLILLYAGSVSFKTIIILIYLIAKGEINIKPQLKFLSKDLKKEIINVSLYSILASLGTSIIFQIDKIIINQMTDLSNLGVYTIAFYFGTLVVIPSRSLLKISGTIIADAWKNNDLNKISEVYDKSCLNQFIIGGFLFLGIWVNIDNILVILGDDYSEAKWVIFFIGLSYLIDMATGVNGYIIAYSKYYRVALLFIIILIVFVIINNLVLIPIYGITGAAMAIAFSFLLNNILGFLFLFKKYKLQPFNYKFILIIAISGVSYFIAFLLPQLTLFWDIVCRSTVLTIIFGLLVYKLRISEDVNKIVKTIVSRF